MSETVQLLINDRHQLIACGFVSLAPGFEQLGNCFVGIAHVTT
jgi:hypothetical protein